MSFGSAPRLATRPALRVPPLRSPAYGPLPLVLLVGDAARLGPALRASCAVVTAPTAEAAWAVASARVPALVVSAVRLPDGDGLELVAALEAGRATRAVPAILLSSSARGDAAVAAALLGLAARFRPADALGAPTGDDRFLDRVRAGVCRGYADPRFGARALAADLGVSPRQLRRRLVALTGETPRALLRRHRVEAGAALLRRGARSVKEVAHRTGFGSTSGFRAAFQAAFGVAPSAFGTGPPLSVADA